MKRWTFLVFAVVCACCILFAGIKAFAIAVPELLKDIPLYQGSTIKQAMDMTNHAMLIVTVNAGSDAIADFYKKAMGAKGWTAAFQAEQQDTNIIQFHKDKMLFQVSIHQEKGAEPTTYTLLMTTQ